jgi:hypothetical protein
MFLSDEEGQGLITAQSLVDDWLLSLAYVTHREYSQLAYTKVETVNVNWSLMQILPVQIGLHLCGGPYGLIALVLKLQIPPS